MSYIEKPRAPADARSSRLPVSGLLAMALLGFIAILTETLPAGLLPRIGASLGVGDALTGQLATLYALGSVGAATLLQTASADTAGTDGDLAQSMIVTVWNTAIAGGGGIGGLLLDHLGADSFAPAVLLLAAAGALIARHAKAHGFKPGARS